MWADMHLLIILKFYAVQVMLLKSGPGCSKLTSLVNVLLKFQTLISNICQYFLLKKCEKRLQRKSNTHFSAENISVFGYKVVIHLTSGPHNELVKLTMLSTTGPRSSKQSHRKITLPM